MLMVLLSPAILTVMAAKVHSPSRSRISGSLVFFAANLATLAAAAHRANSTSKRGVDLAYLMKRSFVLRSACVRW